MTYLGIDPGLSGGFAFLTFKADGTRQIDLFKTPIIALKTARGSKREYDLPQMLDTLRMCLHFTTRNVEAVIEDVHAMPGQGVTSMFRFGVGFGIWIGVLAAMSIPYRLVQPQTWKKHHGLLGQDKNASRLRAGQRFPELGSLPKSMEGPAEALLMASWAAAQDTHTPISHGEVI